MTTEQFHIFQRARPFRPYVIHVADARSFPIRHLELAALSTGGRTVAVENADGLLEVIDLLLVTSLRPIPAADTTGITDRAGEAGTP